MCKIGAALLFCSITLHLFSQEYAVVEDSKTEYIINSVDDVTIKRYKKVKILEERGLSESLLMNYEDEFRKIKDATVIIYNEQGKKEEKLTWRDATTYSFSSSYEINDSKAFVIDPEWEIYPFTAEISYEVQSKGFTNLPAWIIQDDYHIPTTHTELTVRFSPDLDVGLHRLNGLKEPEKSMEDEMNVYKWSYDNLPSIENRPFGKPLSKSVPRLMIVPSEFQLDGVMGSNESWEAFGQWFLDLNTDLGELSDETKSKLDELKASTNSQTELVKKVYEFMQDRTRYISIQLGIGGFKSLPVDFVDERGYGDCKALSTYTRAMLEYLEIPSNYVLINAGSSRYDVKPDIVCNQFNHVFLSSVVGKDTVWMECTSQLSPVDFHGTFTDGRYALWIADESSQIIQTPKYVALENVQSKSMNILIHENGDATAEVTTSKTGSHFSEAFFYKGSNQEKIRDYNHQVFPFGDYEVVSFDYKIDNDSLLLKEEYRINIFNFVRKARNRMIFNAGVLGENTVISTSEENDNYMEVLRGTSTVEKYNISLPELYYLSNKLDPVTIKSPYGEYSLDVKPVGNKINITRKLLLKDGEYTGKEFLEIKDFLDEVRRADNSKIVLSSKT